jgi:branched-chain amino acid transport system substrate-binding protein
MVRDMIAYVRPGQPRRMVKKAFKNIVNVCLPYFSGGWHTVAQARPENKRRRRMEGGFVVHFASRTRTGLKGALAACLALSLAGCVGTLSGGPDLGTVAQQTTASIPTAPPSGTPTIGNGSVRVALLLPLSGSSQGAAAASALRNAADMAMAEFQNPDLTIVVKDDRGTPEGAREAARQALDDGAELIIGPLFAGSVQSAAQVARQAGRPVIAFSTDASVAANGVYLLSFLAQTEVDRIVDHAVAKGRRSVAALIPETTYGNVVEAQFREATARRGLRLVALERYPAGQPHTAVNRIAPLITGAAKADALFIPDTGEGLLAVGQALAQVGFNPQRVKPLGTGVWNDPRVFEAKALQGGWFAAPDGTGFNAFAERYRSRFGADPTRVATLSYDAVSLAAALARTQGSQRFSEPVLTNQSGFAGADGVFRFRQDGTNERALAVMEIRSGGAAIVSPAPRMLGQSAT